MTESNPLEITDGAGKLVHHDNGDVTIVPDDVSDDDCAKLAALDGSDIADAISARANEAAQQAATEARQEATADVLDHPEKVFPAAPSDAIAEAGPGRTDTATVAAQVADSDKPESTSATTDGEPPAAAGPAFTG